ncbi:helix-turn-helix domain-containing protein [Streptomyces lavendofoliae]|uniref:helix-turn-helix domain-containing protein n=1 Tax=Streptomyces lavendofoliae TaxID=67314 RepID=UPI003D89DD76
MLGPAVEVCTQYTGPFVGALTHGRYGHLHVTTLDVTPHRISGVRVADSDTLPLRHELPDLVIAVQAAGTGVLEQEGRRARLSEADMALFTTARSVTLDFPEPSRMHLLRLPQAVPPVSNDALSDVLVTAIHPETELGALLAPLLASLAEAAPRWRPQVPHRMAGHVTALLTALITDHVAGNRPTADARPAAGIDLMARIRSYINVHLAEPELSPRSIAAAHHISVRYLHRLFSDEGTTISRWIQQQRLEEAGRDLARHGRNGPTISFIAHRWGFVNANHFSRAFRNRYGMTPRDWRDSRHAKPC